jgi:hypothetical protein
MGRLGFPELIIIAAVLVVIAFGIAGVVFLVKKTSSPDRSTSKQCPYCAEWIQLQAAICRFCNRTLT